MATNGFGVQSSSVSHVLPHVSFEGGGSSQLQLLLCAALLSAASRVSPRGSSCTLKLTSEAHGSTDLSPADVGLGSVLVSVAICYYLGISLNLGLQGANAHDFILATKNSSSDGAHMSVQLQQMLPCTREEQPNHWDRKMCH